MSSKTGRFSDCFYDSTLPAEVIEAVAANLTILKVADGAPPVGRAVLGLGRDRRQRGQLPRFVYARLELRAGDLASISRMERSLRETEFNVSQDARGHQTFRTSLPIRPTKHNFHAAADGQLGGIMKVHREWRISGDGEWLKSLWPKVKASLDYCIRTWDPGREGTPKEPHHNTYDIEFWGPDGMCTSFYLGALKAAVLMGQALHEDVSDYAALWRRTAARWKATSSTANTSSQKIQWKDLNAKDPTKALSLESGYSPKRAILEKEGPKYQYGSGCLSVEECWARRWRWFAALARGRLWQDRQPFEIGPQVQPQKRSLGHANPQRPGFAGGREGGLLLCSWPKGGQLSLPFVYSDEVWTALSTKRLRT